MTSTSVTTDFNGYYWIVAWVFTIILLIVVSKTKIGYTFIFFFVVASTILVVLVGSPTIATIFQNNSPSANNTGLTPLRRIR